MNTNQNKASVYQTPMPNAQRTDSPLDWAKPHLVLAGTHCYCDNAPPDKPDDERRHIEPWLSALFQAEHLNLLVGSGFTNGLAHIAGV
ncbi:MAG: hypothetical protein N2Z21_10295, partial [Candidatus Sumerlaeaceae bacterium]|nr:hypothetical protein [Candidatus Sumerlaeaceae bacterium]